MGETAEAVSADFLRDEECDFLCDLLLLDLLRLLLLPLVPPLLFLLDFLLLFLCFFFFELLLMFTTYQEGVCYVQGRPFELLNKLIF